ncbi:MotA/TolQ/ExbB proton channel family protein [Methyloradius palustris]|uniref:MotA/TolQ/ExbB proton channel domain-containing protein n=1 Tax=Methyloradius palustris TaxID=2778876 RepID=A0A8E4BUK1_9PROT|nr:MotA/TolQ/ExbB proton channel family protein [Methyloradius palustris]BCM26285.1 hypothetical protein ZMTM_25440 [Methyloradius palustris]
MFKRLRVYYFYTALPFVILLLGAAIYHKQISNTLAENPHPQINYAIFVITLLGGILILANVRRLLAEGAKLSEFTDELRGGNNPTRLQELALGYNVDIAYVLRMVAASSGRHITPQEQTVLENELNSAASRLNNRNALPQFLTSLLVGMGLLGTFIGLLATLDDIASLISSFSTVNIGVDNPIDVFRDMVARMKAPMRSMGIAFSASMYGLMGSIILGFMMVSVRRCSQELMSLLGSEVAQHIEQALAREGFAYSKTAIEASEGALAAGGNGGALVEATGLGGGRLIELDPTEAKLRKEIATEEVRILRRIEERLSESSRLQDRALQAELDNFGKQRAEMMRAMADHNESVSQFRGELQRVGRQLGTILGLMERGNADMLSQLNEHFTELIQTNARNGTDLSKMSDMLTRMTDESIELRTNITEMITRFSPAEQRALYQALFEEFRSTK